MRKLRRHISLGLLLTYAIVFLHHLSPHHHHEADHDFHSKNEIVEYSHFHTLFGVECDDESEDHEEHEHINHCHKGDDELLRRNIAESISTVFLAATAVLITLDETETERQIPVQSDLIRSLLDSSPHFNRGPPALA